MPPRFLLPETVAHQDGVGAELIVDRSAPALLTLSIHRIIERESLEVSIWGSANGREWRPLTCTIATPVSSAAQLFRAPPHRSRYWWRFPREEKSLPRKTR